MIREKRMTAKQERFVEGYLVDLNATKAAIRAGYSEKTARAMGHENLTKPDIEEAIADALKARRQRTEVTQDRVLEELAVLAFAPITDERLAQLKISDQLTALDKLAKHLGMFTERVHHSGQVATNVREMSDEELRERVSHLANRFTNLEVAHTNGGSRLPPHTP